MKEKLKSGLMALGAWGITNRPKIYGIGSDILNAGSSVAAVLATVSAERKVKKAKKAIDDVQVLLEHGDISESDAKVLVRRAIVKAVGAISAVYAPSVAMLAGSILLHGKQVAIMVKRQNELLAAYATLKIAYDGLKKQVAEKFGGEELKMMEEGLKEKENPDQNGARYVSELTPEEAEERFIFYFDEESTDDYEDNNDMNRLFLIHKFQKIANYHFYSNGYLRPNDFMMHELGFKKPYLGLDNFVWVYNKEDKDKSEPDIQLTLVERNGVEVWQIRLKNLKPAAQAVAEGYIIG